MQNFSRRSSRASPLLFLSHVVLLALAVLQVAVSPADAQESFLLSDWNLISSSNTTANGAEISSPGNGVIGIGTKCSVASFFVIVRSCLLLFDGVWWWSRTGFPDEDWLSVQVPCTVMAGLIQNGYYPEVFYADNLKLVDQTQFNNYSWWYRTEFDVTDDQLASSSSVRVTFKVCLREFYLECWSLWARDEENRREDE